MKHSETLFVFVGGPFQFALRNDGTFDPEVKRRILWITNALEQVGCVVRSAHHAENFGEVNVQGQSRALVARDYEWTRTCDVYIALLPRGDSGSMRTDGTCVELGWASALKKPIIVVKDGAVAYSHMIDGLPAITEVTFVDISDLDRDAAQLVKAVLNSIVVPNVE